MAGEVATALPVTTTRAGFRGLVAAMRRGFSGPTTRRAKRENLQGWLWASPWILGFFLWTFGPMLWSLYMSFTRFQISGRSEWLGLANYIRALSGQDSLFWPSLLRTFTWAIVMVPLSLAGSMLAALLLNQGLRGGRVFRTLFFLPSLTPAVASAVLWRWLYQPDFGVFNTVLRSWGVDQPPLWFSDQSLAMPSLMIMTLWGAVGGSTMIIFLAGLQGVPVELHEAASMDGAGTFSRFRHVTLPMMTPTIFFNLVIGVIAALRTFTTAFVATNGGPNYSTWFYILHLYQTAFQSLELGYASALAWVFFIVVVTLTLLNLRFSRNWVYYEGGRP
jgi:multiple sugar transport system permease protein